MKESRIAVLWLATRTQAAAFLAGILLLASDAAWPQARPAENHPATADSRESVPHDQADAQKPGARATVPALVSCAENLASERKAEELAPNDSSLELRLARSLVACQQYTEAIARYQRILGSSPDTQSVPAELAEVMLRDRRAVEAIQVSRRILQLNPQSSVAQLLLARALAATGGYSEALLRYDEVLKAAPENQDALEGKGYVLYWTHRYSEAATIFESLAAARPGDVQLREALRSLGRAQDDASWEALRPAEEAAPQEFVSYYEKRLAAYPNERTAMKGLAYSRARSRDFESAIRAYHAVLALYPDDRDSKIELARLLAGKGQYDSAIELYRDLLAGDPNDLDMLETLARVYARSHQPSEAAATYKELLGRRPSEMSYQLQIARLQVTLKNYRAARQNLLPLLATDPENREARLLLAQVDLKQGHYRSSLRQFHMLLRQDPRNGDAAFGEAQIAYYQDHLALAETLSSALVKDHPENFDMMFLLAAIERARHHEREAGELLDHANRISPRNTELESLRAKVKAESGVSIHTAASYAREVGRQAEPGTPELPSEDLRALSFGTTIQAAALPRTVSYFSLTSLPVSSPFGAIQGAAAPAEFLYRQNTQATSFLSLKGGAGLARFGPGTPQLLPGQVAPVSSAGVRPIGFVGLTLSPERAVSLDLSWSRMPIDYTPLSVRLGVIEQRAEVGVNFFPNSRTQVHLIYYQAKYASQTYLHTTFIDPQTLTENKADRDSARGVSLLFNRNIIRGTHLDFDVGYSGLAYGFQGPRLHVFMGFFNPSFYERHLLTTRFRGTLVGPLGYDFSASIGVQQVDHGQPFGRAEILSPALTLRASGSLSLTLGYTHYNTAQSVGVVRGNSVTVSSDFRF